MLRDDPLSTDEADAYKTTELTFTYSIGKTGPSFEYMTDFTVRNPCIDPNFVSLVISESPPDRAYTIG